MFSKKRAANPMPAMPGKAKAPLAGSFSIIGADVTITGDIAAGTELHIEGAVTGDIACAGLIQGESGVVKGAIRAKTARLAGRVEGSVDAGELVIQRSAVIDGDARYHTLTIEQGAQVTGRFSPLPESALETPADGGGRTVDPDAGPDADTGTDKAADKATDKATGGGPHLTIAN